MSVEVLHPTFHGVFKEDHLAILFKAKNMTVGHDNLEHKVIPYQPLSVIQDLYTDFVTT